jgi:hypothetical protein
VQTAHWSLQCQYRAQEESCDQHQHQAFELYAQDNFNQEIILEEEVLLYEEEYGKDDFEDSGQSCDLGQVNHHIFIQETYFDFVFEDYSQVDKQASLLQLKADLFQLEENLILIIYQAQHCCQASVYLDELSREQQSQF